MPVTRGNQQRTFGLQAGPQGARYTRWGANPSVDVLMQAMAAQRADTNLRYGKIMRSWVTADAIIAQDVRYIGATAVRLGAKQVIEQVAVNYVGQFAQLLAAFDDALKSEIDRNSQQRMMDIYSEVAKAATSQVVAAYRKGLKKNNLKYRGADPGRYQRFSGGRMEAALRDSLFRVTPQGLEYILTPLLDRAAPQWYRLNFGTQPRGGVPAREFNIKVFDATVAGPNLKAFAPSKAFNIPAGFWSNKGFDTTEAFMAGRKASPGSGRGVAFYPIIPGLNSPTGMFAQGRMSDTTRNKRTADAAGKMPFAHGPVRPGRNQGAWTMSARQSSRGIYGTGFLDEGMKVFNRMMGPSLEYMFTEWAVKAGGDAARVTGGKGSPTVGSGPLYKYGAVQNTAWVEQLRMHIGNDQKWLMKTKNDVNVAVQRLLDAQNQNLLRSAELWKTQGRVRAVAEYSGPAYRGAVGGAARRNNYEGSGTLDLAKFLGGLGFS